MKVEGGGCCSSNGVQVSRGAAADVHHNEITANNFSGPVFGGTGVILFEANDAALNVGYNDVYRTTTAFRSTTWTAR